MNTYSNEKGGSDDRASSRVSATTGERALEKEMANNILRILPIGPSAETASHELAVKTEGTTRRASCTIHRCHWQGARLRQRGVRL